MKLSGRCLLFVYCRHKTYPLGYKKSCSLIFLCILYVKLQTVFNTNWKKSILPCSVSCFILEKKVLAEALPFPVAAPAHAVGFAPVCPPTTHCSRGLLTTDIWLHRFLVNTEPLWILVTESRCVRLWILLYASCSSWHKILGSSTADSRHTFPMVTWGTIWIGISVLSYLSSSFCPSMEMCWLELQKSRGPRGDSELFWACMDWKQV